MEAHREQRGARTGRRRPVGPEGSRGRILGSHAVGAVGMAGRRVQWKLPRRLEPRGSLWEPGAGCRAASRLREAWQPGRRGRLRHGGEGFGVYFGEENLGRSPRLCSSQRLSPVTEVWVSVLLPAVRPPPSWPCSNPRPPWEPKRRQSRQAAQADADSTLQAARDVFRDQPR